MGILIRFPRACRSPPPVEREPLDTLQSDIREALADAVTLSDVLAEALALADELAATREHQDA